MIECADQLIKLSKGRPIIISLPRKTDIHVNVHLKPDCVYFNGRYSIIIIYSTTILLNIMGISNWLPAVKQIIQKKKMSLRVNRYQLFGNTRRNRFIVSLKLNSSKPWTMCYSVIKDTINTHTYNSPTPHTCTGKQTHTHTHTLSLTHTTTHHHHHHHG